MREKDRIGGNWGKYIEKGKDKREEEAGGEKEEVAGGDFGKEMSWISLQICRPLINIEKQRTLCKQNCSYRPALELFVSYPNS